MHTDEWEYTTRAQILAIIAIVLALATMAATFELWRSFNRLMEE